MIPVRRPELVDGPGKDWREEAERKMNELVANYKPGADVDIDETLYQAAKPFLLAFNHGKCAYCESLIPDTQPGDVEHYRPKGRVRDRDGKVVKVRIGDIEAEHPGYWWLAYSWSNLLPSCIGCNRRRVYGESGVQAGKADLFAVRGKRAVFPGDNLDQEDALLLDPSQPGFDPTEHFEFLRDGTIKPRSEQAMYTCELLGLNETREALVAQRTRAYYEAKEKIASLFSRAIDLSDDDLVRLANQVNAMWTGQTPHSAFARTAVEEFRAEIRRRLNIEVQLPLPVPT